MAQVSSGQVKITLVIELENRQVATVVAAEVNGVNTTIEDCPDQQIEQYKNSAHGLQTVETIFETDTQSPNTCFIVIGNKKVPVPCS